jgi:hypothetical protein
MNEGKYIYGDNNGYEEEGEKRRKLLQKLILPSVSGESFIARKRRRVGASRPADCYKGGDVVGVAGGCHYGEKIG